MKTIVTHELTRLSIYITIYIFISHKPTWYRDTKYIIFILQDPLLVIARPFIGHCKTLYWSACTFFIRYKTLYWSAYTFFISYKTLYWSAYTFFIRYKTLYWSACTFFIRRFQVRSTSVKDPSMLLNI